MELNLGLNYQNALEINITPMSGMPTWVEVKKGFANLTEGMNEVLYQASFLGDSGWGSTEVTGGQYIITLTGVRYFGDVAQDWIFSDDVMYKFGDYRKTQLRITRGNVAILLWEVTLANITNAGGDANQPGAITVAIHGNGAPTIISSGGGNHEALELASIVPAADATNVALTTNIVLAFNNKILNDDVFLIDSPTGSVVPITKSWDATGKILTINPASSLIASHRHAVIISNVCDIYGQTLSGTASYFTTMA